LSTLLITGGSGFFGKSLLDAFARGRLAPYGVSRVIAVARHASSLRSDAPDLLRERVDVIDVDVLRLNTLFGADLIIHAAASSDAARYKVDAASERDIIVEGTQRIVTLAESAQPKPKLLYVSSGAVYGRQPHHVIGLNENSTFLEDGDAMKAAYALAKREAEAIVRRSAGPLRLRASIARCFAFVGPWLPRDRHFAIGNFIGNALLREPIAVKARHDVIRSYLFADDLVDWLLQIMFSSNENCPVYNVGSDEAISVRDLAKLVGRIGDVPVSLPQGEVINEPVSIDRYVPDISLARRELGLSVTVPLRTAIWRTLEMLDARRLGFQAGGRDV